MIDLPIFNEPDIVQKSKNLINESPWSNVADFILQAKVGQISNYLDTNNKAKNLPFLYTKIDNAIRVKSSIRKSRRIGFNSDSNLNFSSVRSLSKDTKKLSFGTEVMLTRNETFKSLDN